MTLGSQPDLPRGTLSPPTFSDGDETLNSPARKGEADTPWWRERRVVVLIAAALLLLVGASVTTALLLARRSNITLQYQRVAQGNLELTVSASGPVRSGIYTITFSGSAKIATIAVAVGDVVTAGEALATLDATSLQDAVNQAQANAAAAQTALDNAQTHVDQVSAQTQADLQAAYDQEQLAIQACHTPTPTPEPSPGTPTPTPTASATASATPTGNETCIQHAEDQFAAAQAQATAQNAAAQAEVRTAQAQLATADARLQTAEDNLNDATITAPHDGTVSQVNGHVGETPGATFIQIVDLSSLQVVANVNEADIGAVAEGDAVRFSVSAYGPRQFFGTVDAFSPVGQTTANVVTFAVTIDVDGASAQGAHLFPGMTASVTIVTAQRFQVVLVPVRAITLAQSAVAGPYRFITPSQAHLAQDQARQLITQLETNGVDVTNDNPMPAFVLERSKSSWVVRPVVLGLTDGASYEILAGLSVGDTIVVGVQGIAATR